MAGTLYCQSAGVGTMLSRTPANANIIEKFTLASGSVTGHCICARKASSYPNSIEAEKSSLKSCSQKMSLLPANVGPQPVRLVPRQRQRVVLCNAEEKSGGFDPAQLQRDLDRLKRQEEKRKAQKRRKILEAADPSPSKSQNLSLIEGQLGNRGFDPDALEQDLERLRGLENRNKVSKSQTDGLGVGLSKDELQEAKSFFQTTKEWSDNTTRATKAVIDSILVADFFFIILVLLWLIAGVVERQALDSTRLLDVWLPLWGTVFQPAIGVLMAGTIISGTISSLSADPNERS